MGGRGSARHRQRFLQTAAAAAAVWFLAASGQAELDRLNLLARSAGAKSAEQVRAGITSLPLEAREEFIFREIAQGNVPEFLRALKPVTVSGRTGEQVHVAIFYATPDYFSLGTDSDYFLMPMTPALAQRVADYLGCVLPTRKMVNEMWNASTDKFEPLPIPPSPDMVTVPVFWEHNSMVRAQRAASAMELGAMTCGAKKDVVISTQLASKPGKVAIYGWQHVRPYGTVIQPLYLGHEITYADYSHGVRLVCNEMLLDGKTTTVQSILADPVFWRFLSDEGPIREPRYPSGAASPAHQ